MGTEGNTRDNMKRAFNGWLLRVFIKPTTDDYAAKLTITRNRFKMAFRGIIFLFIAWTICSFFYSATVLYLGNGEDTKGKQNSSSPTTSVTTAGNKKDKSAVTKITTDTKVTSKTADGSSKTEETHKEETVTKPGAEKASAEPKTISELIVGAFVKKGLAAIIFYHLLALLVLFIIDHLLLLWLGDIKRFKFGNLEVEKNSTEKGVVSTLDQIKTKLDMVNSWTKKVSTTEINALTQGKLKVKEYLEVILKLMQNDYLSYLKVSFDYDIFPVNRARRKSYPFGIERAMQVLEQDPKAMVINKENQDSLLESNYIVFKIKVEETTELGASYEVEYAIVLSSFRNEFDEYDLLVLEASCNLMYAAQQRDYYAEELLIADQLAADNRTRMQEVTEAENELERSRMLRSENY